MQREIQRPSKKSAHRFWQIQTSCGRLASAPSQTARARSSERDVDRPARINPRGGSSAPPFRPLRILPVGERPLSRSPATEAVSARNTFSGRPAEHRTNETRNSETQTQPWLCNPGRRMPRLRRADLRFRPLEPPSARQAAKGPWGRAQLGADESSKRVCCTGLLRLNNMGVEIHCC